jgi:hypothetical protein
MRIELYVVKTKATAKVNLELYAIKKEIIKEYGGLTELKEAKGYWLNSGGEIEYDTITIWVILEKDGAENTEYPMIERYAKRIKLITKQQSQLFTINNQPYFI